MSDPEHPDSPTREMKDESTPLLEGQNAQKTGKEERITALREADALLLAGFDGLSNESVKLSSARRTELLGQAAERLMRLNRMWNEIEPAAEREKQAMFYTAEMTRLRAPLKPRPTESDP